MFQQMGMKSSSSQTDNEIYICDSIKETCLTMEPNGCHKLREEPEMVVGSPAMVMGRTYQYGSTLALSAKPRDTANDASSISTNSNRRISSDDGLIIHAELIDDSDKVLGFRMMDEFGEPYKPVKPKCLAVCCH